MNIHKETLVSDIVANNYKTATVFKNHEIDFCCNGNRSIETVCNNNENNINDLLNDLESSFKEETETIDYKSWDIDFLSDYIYNKHHKYVESKIPELKQYLQKLCKVHSNTHPELIEINTLFKKSADDLVMHMKKEELILFPYFKLLAADKKVGRAVQSVQFDSVQSPISLMHKEHDNEGERFRKISTLSNGYTPPHDACNTYKVTFSMLKEFEDDLHKHIHLENNILFKKAVEIEKELA